MPRVRIEDLGRRDEGGYSYKVIDIDTGDKLILTGETSLTHVINMIGEKAWELIERMTEDGQIYDWHENKDGSHRWKLKE